MKLPLETEGSIVSSELSSKTMLKSRFVQISKTLLDSYQADQ
jgi:hypothetical protein